MNQAAERVQDTGGLAWVQPETLGDVICYASCCDSRDGVVGCADVGQGHQAGNTEFSPAFSPDSFGHTADDEIKTSICADDLQHTSGQHSDDYQVAHSADSAAYALEPTAPIQATL